MVNLLLNSGCILLNIVSEQELSNLEVEVENLENILTIRENILITETGINSNSAYNTYYYDVSNISNLTKIVATTTISFSSSKALYAIAFNDANNNRISTISKG